VLALTLGLGYIKPWRTAMPYEKFKRTKARVDSPTIALAPRGTIALNAAASRAMEEAGVKAVMLLWDRDANRLAIKATSKTDKDAFALSISPGSHSGSIRAKSFLSHIGWESKERRVFAAAWDKAQKMLEADLNVDVHSDLSQKIAKAMLKNKTGL
jgi:hypothetical protein